MAVSKWDLFKRIEQVPEENYPEIKKYLEQLIEEKEVVLDEKSKGDVENH